MIAAYCHILTCAHAFLENASEGTGKLTADPKTISFSFPDPADPLNEETPKYQAASVSILPEFMEKKDDAFYGKGHRKVGYDLAIVTLEKCVPDAKPYRYNDGMLIKEERDEKWSKDGGTIKVGFGRGGNGDVGANDFVITAPATTAQSGVSLEVENGTGDGSYAPGTMVAVTADPAPAGQHFVGWTGDIVILSNANIATTTAIIPSMDVGIAAKYRMDAQISFPIEGNKADGSRLWDAGSWSTAGSPFEKALDGM
jgi:Divergent InlB B-repeat domain